MNTIPKLNIRYWLMMILATTIGELVGNLISRNFELGYTTGALIDILIFTITIFLFALSKSENFLFYWILILMGNIGGTNIADFVTLEPLPKDLSWHFIKPLELGTQNGSLLVLGILGLILLIWKSITPKDSINKPFNLVSTILYWAAILISSTFGTTSGDYITNDTPLGALGGSIFLFILLSLIYILYKRKILNETLCYWIALVLIHPIGATIGNYISKPIGLNFGNLWTSIILFTTMLILFLNPFQKLHFIQKKIN